MAKQKSTSDHRKLLVLVAVLALIAGIGVFLRIYFLMNPPIFNNEVLSASLEPNNPVALNDLEVPQLSATLPILGANVTNPNQLPDTPGIWLKITNSSQTKFAQLNGLDVIERLSIPGNLNSFKFLSDGTLLFTTFSTNITHAQLWEVNAGSSAKVLYTAEAGDEINGVFFEPAKKNLYLLLQSAGKQLFRVVMITPTSQVQVVYADKQDASLDLLYADTNIVYVRNTNCLAISLETKQSSTKDCNLIPQSFDQFNFVIDSSASIVRYDIGVQQRTVILAAQNLQSYSLLHRESGLLGFLIMQLPEPGSSVIPLNQIQLIDQDGNPIISYTKLPAGTPVKLAVDRNQNAYVVVQSASQTQDLYVHLKEGEDKWQKITVPNCDSSCKYEFLQ